MSETITFHTTTEVKKLLDQRASDNRRSRSAELTVILEEFLGLKKEEVRK